MYIASILILLLITKGSYWKKNTQNIKHILISGEHFYLLHLKKRNTQNKRVKSKILKKGGLFKIAMKKGRGGGIIIKTHT